MSNSASASHIGRWFPVSAQLGGQAWPDAMLESMSLALTESTYEVMVGATADRGTYTIDPASKPAAMTIAGTDGPNAGKTIPAIYEVHGDALTVCYNLMGPARPSAFESLSGTMMFLVRYERRAE